MGILDLPLELFRPIIEDALGFCACCWDQPFDEWDNLDMLCLARVNTIFESEVFRIWGRRRFLLSGKPRPSHELLAHRYAAVVFARYISQLPNDFPDWRAHFPALINHVVDMIIKLERPKGDWTQVRADYIRRLCHSASFQNLAFTELDNESLTDRPFRDHLLVGAVYLEKVTIVDELTQLQLDTMNMESEFWSTPLNAAILVGSLELTRKLVLLGATLKNDISRWSYISHAVRSKYARDMVPLLLRRNEHNGSYESICSFERILMLAIQLDKESVADMVLESHRALFGHGSLAYILRETLREACKKGMKMLVSKLELAGGYSAGGRSVRNELRGVISNDDASENSVIADINIS